MYYSKNENIRKIFSSLIILFILFIYSPKALSQDCHCSENIKWLINNVEDNYSGFFDKVNKKSIPVYKQYSNLLLKKDNVNSIDSCLHYLNQYLSFFNDKHLYIRKASGALSQYSLSELKRNTCIIEIDSNIMVFKLPGFSTLFKEHIDSLIYSNFDKLISHSVLILDVRNNLGGDDRTWSSLLPFLYTNNFESSGVEIRVSPDNINTLKLYGANDEVHRKNFEIISKSKKKFELITKPKISFNYDRIFSYPAHIIILQNEQCASSCEQLLIYGKQSKKVYTIGETSMGVLDYSNCFDLNFPDKRLILQIPISRRIEVKTAPIDNIGLSPQLKIDKEVTDWLKFAIKYAHDTFLNSRPIRFFDDSLSRSIILNIIEVKNKQIEKYFEDKNYDKLVVSLKELLLLVNKVDKKEVYFINRLNQIINYYIGIAYGLKNEIDFAKEYLFRSIDLGFYDYKYITEDTVFNKIIDKVTFNIVKERIWKNHPLIKYNTFGRKDFSIPKIIDYRKNTLVSRNNIKLDSVAFSGNEFSMILSVMEWVHSNFKSNFGIQPIFNLKIASNYEKYSNSNIPINSIMLPYILHNIYLRLGFKSRYIIGLPYEKNSNSCYPFCSVYSKSLNSWVLMDPIVGNYFCNSKGKVLNIDDIRNNIMYKDSVNIYGKFDFGGKKLSKLEYTNLVIPNLFRYLISTNTIGKNNVFVQLCPDNYQEDISKPVLFKDETGFYFGKDDILFTTTNKNQVWEDNIN